MVEAFVGVHTTQRITREQALRFLKSINRIEDIASAFPPSKTLREFILCLLRALPMLEAKGHSHSLLHG